MTGETTGRFAVFPANRSDVSCQTLQGALQGALSFASHRPSGHNPMRLFPQFRHDVLTPICYQVVVEKQLKSRQNTKARAKASIRFSSVAWRGGWSLHAELANNGLCPVKMWGSGLRQMWAPSRLR